MSEIGFCKKVGQRTWAVAPAASTSAHASALDMIWNQADRQKAISCVYRFFEHRRHRHTKAMISFLEAEEEEISPIWKLETVFLKNRRRQPNILLGHPCFGNSKEDCVV
jgi:hypothetical protein